MNSSLLKDFPQTPLDPAREQELLQAGDTEIIVMYTIARAFKYAQNARKGKANIAHAEILSICYSALSRSIKTFKPGMQDFLTYSKPFIRGEMCRHWRDQDVVKDAFRHEEPQADEFPKPISSDCVEFDWNGCHWKEMWEQVEPIIRETLSPVEIKVLELRYKFSRTLQDTGVEIGKSRERVRQIEKAALEKLRAALSNRGDL